FRWLLRFSLHPLSLLPGLFTSGEAGDGSGDPAVFDVVFDFVGSVEKPTAICESQKKGVHPKRDHDGGQGEGLWQGVCHSRWLVESHDRRSSGPSARHQQQEVGSMPEHGESDNDPAQIALQEQIRSGSVQYRDGDGHGNDDHSVGSCSPRATTRAVERPTTTKKTPISNGRALVALTCPSTGSSNVSFAPSRKVSPHTHPRSPVVIARARPVPISASDGSATTSTIPVLPRATKRRVTAIPTTRPATKPPPGALCPVKRRNRAKTRAVRAMRSTMMSRMRERWIIDRLPSSRATGADRRRRDRLESRRPLPALPPS